MKRLTNSKKTCFCMHSEALIVTVLDLLRRKKMFATHINCFQFQNLSKSFFLCLKSECRCRCSSSSSSFVIFTLCITAAAYTTVARRKPTTSKTGVATKKRTAETTTQFKRYGPYMVTLRTVLPP